MTRAARQQQTLTELLDAIDASCTVVRRDGPAVIDRASIPSGRDGYPARASGAQATSPRIVRHETTLDLVAATGLWHAGCNGCGWRSVGWVVEQAAFESARQHEDEHDQALDYSDPTGEAAAAGHEPDPILALARRVLKVMTDVERLVTPLANALVAETGKGAKVAEPTDWCTHHLHHGMHEPRRVKRSPDGRDQPSGDLCRWCTWFRDANDGTLPPKELLDKHARGERITQRDVERTTRRKAG